MKKHLSQAQHPLLLLVLLIFLWPAATTAAPEYMRFYKTGLIAKEQGNWEQVESMMEQAMTRYPEEKWRRFPPRGGYFPYYYFGLARYQLGDCSGALHAWAESENQGVIVGRHEYTELLRLREDCNKNESPTLRNRSEITLVKEKKNAKEKVRTGQKWIEKGAKPVKKALGVIEEISPDSKIGQAARDGQKVIEVAEVATEVVDALLSPSESLRAAINAYFSGNPWRTLDLLQEIAMKDPRIRAQVYLFRAAASYRLYLLDESQGNHQSKARENAQLFQKEQWREDFPAKLFDPRFVRFLRGGG